MHLEYFLCLCQVFILTFSFCLWGKDPEEIRLICDPLTSEAFPAFEERTQQLKTINHEVKLYIPGEPCTLGFNEAALSVYCT